MRKPPPSVPHVQVVVFRLGSSEFGLEVSSVHEVIRREGVTPIPKAPAFVEGVIDLRGTLVPVVDLRCRFELVSASDDVDARILVVQFVNERLGLIVDTVTEVVGLPEAAVSPPPPYFRGLAAEYIRGIARLPGRLIILLDIDRILSSEERIALEEAELVPASAGEENGTPELGGKE